MKILITGGAGYIGSHTTVELIKAKHTPIIVDDFSNSKKWIIPRMEKIAKKKIIVYEGDCGDKNFLDSVFEKEKNIDGVIHFAGLIEVGESMLNPKKFFKNNIDNGLILLEVMFKHQVKKIIFSSSAAVYGNPKKMPIKEDRPKKPINVYGATKLKFENILNSYDKNHGLKSICLRYFNASGAHPSGEIGENHNPESHIIPLILKTAMGKQEAIKIFGTDYPTYDGTTIRDYVHVCDLANAHILALEYLKKNNKSEKFNLGSEKGTSLLEMIKVAKEITGNDFFVIEAEKRSGDPAILCADSKKAQAVLKWKPELSSVEKIIETAWNWEKNNR